MADGRQHTPVTHRLAVLATLGGRDGHGDPVLVGPRDTPAHGEGAHALRANARTASDQQRVDAAAAAYEAARLQVEGLSAQVDRLATNADQAEARRAGCASRSPTRTAACCTRSATSSPPASPTSTGPPRPRRTPRTPASLADMVAGRARRRHRRRREGPAAVGDRPAASRSGSRPRGRPSRSSTPRSAARSSPTGVRRHRPRAGPPQPAGAARLDALPAPASARPASSRRRREDAARPRATCPPGWSRSASPASGRSPASPQAPARRRPSGDGAAGRDDPGGVRGVPPARPRRGARRRRRRRRTPAAAWSPTSGAPARLTLPADAGRPAHRPARGPARRRPGRRPRRPRQPARPASARPACTSAHGRAIVADPSHRHRRRPRRCRPRDVLAVRRPTLPGRPLGHVPPRHRRPPRRSASAATTPTPRPAATDGSGPFVLPIGRGQLHALRRLRQRRRPAGRPASTPGRTSPPRSAPRCWPPAPASSPSSTRRGPATSCASTTAAASRRSTPTCPASTWSTARPSPPASRSARSATSGNTTGPHLHFEVRLDGVAVDPAQVLDVPEAPRATYPNGEVPDDALCAATPGGVQQLRCDAAVAYRLMGAAVRAGLRRRPSASPTPTGPAPARRTAHVAQARA